MVNIGMCSEELWRTYGDLANWLGPADMTRTVYLDASHTYYLQM